MAAPLGNSQISDAPRILTDLQTGVLYKNPQPHLTSRHAYFPSVAVLPDGEIVATSMIGEAFEAVNCRVHVSRSTDQGESWEVEGALAEDINGQLISESGRITAIDNGELVALLHRHDRTAHPHEGLANPETMGFVPTDFALARSTDNGRTWSSPQSITPPLVGPSFELCCPITILKDGRWLLPTSTWRGWDGKHPSGDRMLAFVSHDQGKTWPSYFDVMRSERDDLLYWESKVVELHDGRLLAVAWVYDNTNHCDLPNHYALSHDGGTTWTVPKSTGLLGQTMAPLVLADDRILCVYRRMDQPGLWCQLAHLEADDWFNDDAQPLWGHDAGGLTATDESMVSNFQVLRFGAPCMTLLADGSVYVAFWGYEDCVSIIRWFKFRVAV